MRALHKLEMGRFYVAADGYIWCCYKVYPDAADHCRAWCIRLMDNRHEPFFLDGTTDFGRRKVARNERASCTLKREVLLDAVIRNASGDKDQVDRWRLSK